MTGKFRWDISLDSLVDDEIASARYGTKSVLSCNTVNTRVFQMGLVYFQCVEVVFSRENVPSCKSRIWLRDQNEYAVLFLPSFFISCPSLNHFTMGSGHPAIWQVSRTGYDIWTLLSLSLMVNWGGSSVVLSKSLIDLIWKLYSQIIW